MPQDVWEQAEKELKTKPTTTTTSAPASTDVWEQADAELKSSGPGFMDSPIPGITSSIGLTPRHIERGVKSFGSTLASIPGQAWDIATDPANLLFPGVGGMANQMIVQPAIEQGKKSIEAGKEGRTSEAVGHGLAAVIPGVGPMAAHAGEQIGAGKLPELAGELGAAALTGKALGKLPGAAKAIGSPSTLLDTFKDPPDAVLVQRFGVQPRYATTILDELKSSGVDVKDIPTAKEALKVRKSTIIPAYKAIMEPTARQVVPGSAMEMLSTEVSSIPDYIRLERPAEYARLVKKLRDAYNGQKDFTRGELDQIRSSRAAANTSAYSKGPSARIAADETMKAIDIAAEMRARNLLFDALKADGTGLADVARELNQAKGALIHFEDALKPYEGQSYVESRQGTAGRMLRSYDKTKAAQRTLAGTVGAPIEELLTGQYESINKTLADTMRRWPGRQGPSSIDNPFLPGQPRNYTPEQLSRLAAYRPGVFLPERTAPGYPALPPPPDPSMASGSPAIAEAGTRATRKGLLIPKTATPSPMSIPGQPPIGQGAQVRGVEPTVAGQLPMQPSRLDFGSGRVPVTPNQQLSGEATTPPLRKPAGPGVLLTRDPKVLQSTLTAIDQMLKNRMLTPAYRAELMDARAKLMSQSQLPPPPK